MSVAVEGKEQKERQLPAIAGPRLPYHPAIEQRFGIDVSSWRALVEAVFPNATSINSVIMALSYCKARKLDPFKRVVHIVPIWNKQLSRMVDTVWPGIGELRTTAFRTGEYAGRDRTVFGPDVTMKVGSKEMTFPEWAQVSVFRVIKGQRVEFAGPQVYWIETYATVKRDDDTPNDMWKDRPRGQIDKCAEAAALRAAFPEEVGGDYIPEEVQHHAQAPALAESKTIDDISMILDGPAEVPEGVADDGEITPFVSEGCAIVFASCITEDDCRDKYLELCELHPDHKDEITRIEAERRATITKRNKPKDGKLPMGG